MKKIFAITRFSFALLLITTAGAYAQSATAPATVPSTAPVTQPAVSIDAELQSAAKPLIDFTTWCISNKARTAGEKAVAAAKTIVDSPAGADQASAALALIKTDDSASPLVPKREQVAYAAAADHLQAIANSIHQPEDESQANAFLIKAARFSPAGRSPALEAAMDHAIQHHHTASVIDLYGVLLDLDAKYAAKQEPTLAEKGILPVAAQKLTTDWLAADQAVGALTYLNRIANVDVKGFAAGKYQSCTDVLASRSFLIHSPTHPIVAYVSIPWKWQPGKPAPVIFCFAGVQKEYKNICDNFHGVIGDGPFIVVSPVTLSNTTSVSEDSFKQWYTRDVVQPYLSNTLNGRTIAQRLEFDVPGIVALAKTIHDAAGTEEQIYLTGFSGGGLPCYGTMITSPNIIAAAAPACANYYLSMPARGRSNNTAVQQFFGDVDGFNATIGNGPGLIAQGHEAAAALGAMGYNVSEPVLVPNTGHSPMATQVVDFFATARATLQAKNKQQQ